MNMQFYRKLPIPQDIKEEYPLTPDLAALKAAEDKEIRDIFESKSNKFLLVIGPCSADNEDSVADSDKLRHLRGDHNNAAPVLSKAVNQ